MWTQYFIESYTEQSSYIHYSSYEPILDTFNELCNDPFVHELGIREILSHSTIIRYVKVDYDKHDEEVSRVILETCDLSKQPWFDIV